MRPTYFQVSKTSCHWNTPARDYADIVQLATKHHFKLEKWLSLVILILENKGKFNYQHSLSFYNETVKNENR